MEGKENWIVIKAINSDTEDIINLLKETALWLRQIDIEQWGYLLSGGEDEEIKHDVETGAAYVIKEKGKLIGTFTLYTSPSEWDSHIWQTHDENCLYLHRLAIDRQNYKGKGIGQQVLAEIGYIARKLNKSIIKLDCVGNNKRLNQYYLENGFKLTGTTPDGHSQFIKILS